MAAFDGDRRDWRTFRVDQKERLEPVGTSTDFSSGVVDRFRSLPITRMSVLAQGIPSQGSWPLDHPVPAMIVWCAIIIAICVPLALHRFRTATSA